jgi:CDP-4-dehydro-6-deoxyglucose reductase, E3
MAEAWNAWSAPPAAQPLSFADPYEVVVIERRTATIVEVWLRSAGDDPEYLPGEYVLLEETDHDVPPRSCSMANAPRPDGLIWLLVARVPGGRTSTWVHPCLRVGDEVKISGPYGTFVDDPASAAPGDVRRRAGDGRTNHSFWPLWTLGRGCPSARSTRATAALIGL